MTQMLPERFILYRREWDATAGKWQKIPCGPDGHNINHLDPSQWMTFAQASALATWQVDDPAKPHGVAWVLNGDGWFFLDLDNCSDGTNWSSEATIIYQSFPGALSEVSTSGKGLHIFGRCDPHTMKQYRNKWDGWLEFYTTGRFVALTQGGLHVIGGGQYIDRDWTTQLTALIPERPDMGDLPTERDPAYTGPEDDDKLIEMMLRSGSTASKFGNAATVKDLWDANVAVLSRMYPAYSEGGDFDHSAADAALMSHLAFWTGKDMPRMDRLFRRSSLMRPKYERKDYRTGTISGAVRMCQRVYDRASRDLSDLDQCHADMGHDDLAHYLFAQRWEGNMLYIPERDKWAEWNGKKWRLARTAQDQITRLRQDLREIPGAEDPSKRKRLGDNKNIMAINALMKTNEGAAKSIEEWDADPFVLGTPTQIVNLRTGEVRQRIATDFLLRSTSCDPSPSGAVPSNWISFLSTITDGDLELQNFLQRLCGYAATGSTKEHKLFFAFGTGRNGKSTLLNTLDAILSADYAKVIPPKLLLDKKTEQHATDLAHLAQARLARASELPVGKVWDEALLKQITGGDQITARYMRQDNFTFRPQCTLIVDANNAPSVRGIDEAFRRRMCVIPFDVTIPPEKVDPDLPDKLLREGPAILRWLIDGAVKWHESGLKIPSRIEKATNEYLDQEDTFGAFINECFDTDPTKWVHNAQIRQAFSSYMAGQGASGWGSASLSKEMRKRGFEPHKSGNMRGFRGLSLKKNTMSPVVN